MARLIWTEPALQELDEIADYISLDDPQAAKNLVQKVFTQVGRLVDHPNSGKPVMELGESAIYREIVVPPCRIFYRIENSVVFLIHIIRDEQLLHVGILKSR